MISEMQPAQLYTESKSGTFIALSLDSQSKRRLYDYCKNNHITSIVKKEDFHLSLIYTDKKFNHEEREIKPRLCINPDSFSIDIFNEKVLVLTIKNFKLELYHRELRSRYAVNWKFDKFRPHVTLSYNCKPKIGIIPPDFPLYFEKEFVENN